MIARMFIPLLLMLVLSDWYIDFVHLRRRAGLTRPKRLLWWLPCVAMMVYTVGLACVHDFVPGNPLWIFVYLLLYGILVVPKVLFALCSIAMRGVGRLIRCQRIPIVRLSAAVGGVAGLTFVYGLTIGVSKFEVKYIDLYVEGLPAAFEGYRIVHFSDAHVGMFDGKKAQWLQRDIDSINAQRADMVVFTGDLQNVQPSEIYRFSALLHSIKAVDGVFSVLGNHDYSMYLKADTLRKLAIEREMVAVQRQMGWHLLQNEHAYVHRGGDSIAVVGTDNDGKPPFPRKSDFKKAMQGVGAHDFVLMLQHDPSSWERNILPHTSARITLSGHTHAGQLSIFGLRPTMLTNKEDYGLYEKQGRYLYVTAGLGGVVPLRVGATAEIAVFTLHQKHQRN